MMRGGRAAQVAPAKTPGKPALDGNEQAASVKKVTAPATHRWRQCRVPWVVTCMGQRPGLQACSCLMLAHISAPYAGQHPWQLGPSAAWSPVSVAVAGRA